MTSRAQVEQDQEAFFGTKQPAINNASGATPTPDATAVETQEFVMTAATVTMQPPKGPRAVGDKLFIVCIQDATGGRTLAWSTSAGGYRNGLGASGTSGQRASFEFRWDGVSWQMTGGSTAFA